jgi:hypothetical protein
MSPGADQHGDSFADPEVQSRAVFLYRRRAAWRFPAGENLPEQLKGTLPTIEEIEAELGKSEEPAIS